MMRELQSVYVMWKRVMIRMIRAKGRLLSTMLQPLLFLVAFGLGLRGAGGSLDFFLPAIIFMSSVMSSAMAGISVMWDREFGFLKEVLVAPVSRLSAVIGRAAGAMTTVLIQAVWIGFVGSLMGADLNLSGALPALLFLIGSSLIAVGIGISFASFIEDFESFQMVQNIVIMPMIFLSSAFINLDGAPGWLAFVASLNPLSYGMDGVRRFLTGTAFFPLWKSVAVTSISATVAMLAAAWCFERIET